jgi:hypothetical protein
MEKETAKQAPDVGVYVLANDQVIEWFTAFVSSFRAYNPTLPLRLIPFDEESSRCEALVRETGGEAYRDEAAFSRLEELGRRLEVSNADARPRWFRRFVAFDGPFDAFAYLDCRMLVLADISRFAAAAHTYEVPVVHFDVAINQVYNQGFLRTDYCRRGFGHGFLSGMFASRKGLFSFDRMAMAVDELVAVRDQMNLRNTDQFFLNYLCDANSLRTCHMADLDSRLTHSAWANDRGSLYEDDDGVWRKWDFGGLEHRQQMIFLHWAGIRLHPSMPHFSLYRRFRRPRRGPLGLLAETLTCAGGKIAFRLRSNRAANTLYHRLQARR